MTTTSGTIQVGTAEPAAQRRRPIPSMRRTGRSRLGWVGTPYLFVLLPVGLLLLFTYVPVANMFWYSVTDWNGLSAEKDFIGLDNYVRVFTRDEYFQVFYVSLFYFVGSFVQLALALYFATVLSFRTRLRNFFKGVLFFPYLINGVAIAFTFLYFFKPDGTLDATLALVGIHSDVLWLGDRDVANFSLAATSVWRYMGLNFVLFLGAIQSIPAQLYEASAIDGANRWHQFRFIILPGIRPILGLSLILAISGSIAVFEIPFIMTSGDNGTMTFVIKTVDVAFENHKVGQASAMAVILLLIVLVVTWIQRRIVPDEKVNLT